VLFFTRAERRKTPAHNAVVIPTTAIKFSVAVITAV
jgi:hypothetical protein